MGLIETTSVDPNSVFTRVFFDLKGSSTFEAILSTRSTYEALVPVPRISPILALGFAYIPESSVATVSFTMADTLTRCGWPCFFKAACKSEPGSFVSTSLQLKSLFHSNMRPESMDVCCSGNEKVNPRGSGNLYCRQLMHGIRQFPYLAKRR